MDEHEARERVLDAAEELFYAHGIQAVGMAEVRRRSGVSLKRLYGCFASKEALVEDYLIRRDRRWNQSLAEHVDRYSGARRRLLAVFDFLVDWFATPDFRGCAFLNAFGELGGVSAPVAGIARSHKAAVRERLRELATEAGAKDAEALAEQLGVLVEGAIAAAALRQGSEDAGKHAKRAAEVLIDAACGVASQ